jgi:hypothetical protein
LQPQLMSTPREVVSCSCSIHHFGHPDRWCVVFATGILLELHMWIRQQCISASTLETVGYTLQLIVKALAEAPHWRIIVKYWNTAMQQSNIWSIQCQICTMKILKDVCRGSGTSWILQAQIGTRFKYKSIRFHPILFD